MRVRVSTARALGLGVGATVEDRQAEVAHLHRRLLGAVHVQQVLGLDVAMHDVRSWLGLGLGLGLELELGLGFGFG